MQTNLGGSSSNAGLVAAYSYAARYVYSDVVVGNDNTLRLTAGADARQIPWTNSVLIQPSGPMSISRDSYGNVIHRVSVTAPHQELTILSIGVLRWENSGELPGDVPLSSLKIDSNLYPYLAPTPLVHPARLADRAGEITQSAGGLLEAVQAVTEWVYRNIQYVKESTTVATRAAEVLESGVGVCQDMTHLTLGFLRALNIPSRYVSGLLTAEVGETHAWVEFWHPQRGWIPADPSRGEIAARPGVLVKFAVGRDYTEAAPVEGTFISGGRGWLDTARAQVQFDRDFIDFDAALSLLE